MREKKDESLKAPAPAEVNAWIKECRHPMVDTIKTLRKMILAADKAVGEEVKWNAPAFFYTGKMAPFDPKEYKRHIVVMNIAKKDAVRLVFLNSAKIKNNSGLLEGDYADGRRLATFTSINEVKLKGPPLTQVVAAWIKLVAI